MEAKKGNKKIIIIAAVIIVAVIAAILLLFLFKNKETSYRLLKIFEVEGTANVKRGSIGDIEPYANMVLESGDAVKLDTGKLTIRADEDKYIHLEDGTELKLTATGDATNSKTKIELMSGAITNDIQNKLSLESSYEVNTPNSTMSVRGTIYRVWIYEENGIKYTKVTVFEGEVATRLVYADGTVSDEEVSVKKGKEVLIYEDGKTTDYVGEPKDIDFSELPESVLNLLKEKIEEDRDVSVTKEDIEQILHGPFRVNFMYNGTVFGSQTVEKGKCAEVPSLAPAASGSWGFNFSTPIEKDTVIEWQ